MSYDSLMPVSGGGNALETHITDSDVPNPEPLPKMGRYNLLVRPMAVKKKSKGGILLPDVSRENIHYLQTVGQVVSMGPDCFNGEKATPACEVGDYVVWSRGRGVRMCYKGVKFVVLVDDEVLMTVPDPTDLNENYDTEK